MNKITIIGLGLVGNSIGMGLKRAAGAGVPASTDGEGQAAASLRLVGFDPSREREAAALRRYGSVDEIAPDLQRAVQGAQLVVICTPAGAAREVLEAIAPFLDEDATVTDTLPTKEAVMSWASELLGPGVSFVGGHPLSKVADLLTASDDDVPNAELFADAAYCILPLPRANNESLNRVIWLAETLGAKPLFIDILEHDSFLAAASNLPVLASATLMHLTAGGPTWADMSGFAGAQYDSVAEPMSGKPELLADALLQNRQALLRWTDQYLLALQEMRDSLAAEDRAALLRVLQGAHTAQQVHARRDHKDEELRAELRQQIDDAKPSRGLMGTYLSERIFRKRT